MRAWIAILGPRDWMPSEPMSLEIGERTWSITPETGGGVVTPNLVTGEDLRLIGRETCHQYAAFAIDPGSAWIIRFDDAGSVDIEDADGQPHAMGPGLVEGTPSDCAHRPSASGG